MNLETCYPCTLCHNASALCRAPPPDLPTTNQSLIFNSTWKLIVAAPSTHWFTPEDDWIQDGASINGTATGDWSCKEHGRGNISTQGIWQCMVCTDAEPCLFK